MEERPQTEPSRAEEGEPEATLMDDGPAPAKELAPGQRVGRYFLLEPLGRGGMGVVYLGYDPELHRRVAVKVLHQREGGSIVNPRRLLREAQALAQVSHPNLVQVYDVGTVEGRVFMAMEVVPGRPLSKWFKDRPPWRAVLEVMVAAGRGLVAAHQAGIVHRDFKPGNVILGDDGSVRVLDFGLARVGAEVEGDSTRSSSASLDLPPELASELSDEDDEPLTRGTVVGTPAYMAPEQHVGEVATVLSDQYGFCVALYEGLYGHRPFPRVPIPKLARLKRQGRLREPPPGVRVPGWLRRVVLKGMAAEPTERFASMEALLERLEVTPTATKLRRVGAIGVVGLVGVTAWAAGRSEAGPSPCDEPEAALAEVWSTARADRIEAAFEGTGMGHAGDTWRNLRPILEDYAAAWVAMRGEACRATHIEGRQSGALLDLRMACLDRRRFELDAVLALYENPDRAFVLRAADGVGALRPLERCADAEALTAAIPPPDSVEDRKTVEEAQRWLAEAEALEVAGQHAAAERRARAALAEGERIGYRPLVAEATYVLSMTLDNDPVAAEQAARDAIMLAAEVRDDGIMRQALRRLMFEVGMGRGRFDEALGIGATAEAVWRRGGLDPEASATLQADLGSLAAARGDAEAARRHFERSLAALDAEDATIPRRMVISGGAAAALMQQGAWDEAREAFLRVRELGVELYGQRNPYVADVDLNLGQIATQVGDTAAANRSFESALEVLEVDPAQHAARLALAYASYGSVAIIEGRPAAARARARRALEHLLAIGDPEGPLSAAAHDVLGSAASFEGQTTEALEHHRTALARATSGFGGGSPNEAVARVHLAESLALAEAWRESERQLDLAEPVLADVFGRDGEHFAELLLTRGAQQLAAGRPEAARDDLQRALSAMPPGDLVITARAQLRLARALDAIGDREVALSHAREARRIAAALELPALTSKIDAWLGEPPS